MQRTATATTSLAKGLALVLLAGGWGCSTTGSGAHGDGAKAAEPPEGRARQVDEQSTRTAQQLDARVRRLEEQNAASAQQRSEERKALGERVAALEQKVNQLQASRAAPQAGATATADARSAEELARLRTRLDEMAKRVAELDAAAQSRRAEDRRIATRRPSGGGAVQGPEPGSQSPRGGSDKRELLAVAMEQERSGNKAAAREVYEQFVKSWPADPLTPEALYRMGELSFGERRYQDAIVAYSRIASDFGQSEQAPDALLRTGESMAALDLKADARGIWQEVQRRYPGSAAARRAEALLAEPSGSRAARSKKR